LNDRLGLLDLQRQFAARINKSGHRPTFYTEIEARNEFGEVLFKKAHNETVLGGALTVLEKVWGVDAALKVDSINNIMGINTDLTPPISESSANENDFVVLWGIGIGGCGDTFGSRRAVHFYEREIGQNGHTDQMIPFRVVSEPFTPSDDNYAKYFMRNKRSDGNYEYYLKAFETTPVIKVLWKDGAKGEDGSEVESDVYATDREDLIEAFVEMHLMIEKTDVQEYFELIGQPEMARVNTIGLFTGRRIIMDDGRPEYVNCKLFSKLNTENDSLVVSTSSSDGSTGTGSSRSIEYIYRVFVAR
jgi:hypothetical protein